MKFVNVSRTINKLRKWLAWFGDSCGACASITLCFILVVGCAHVTPVVTDRDTVSAHNAGIVQQFPDKSLEITPDKLEQYNAMIDLYGNKTVPVTKRNYKITPLPNGNYLMDSMGAERFNALFLIQKYERIHNAK